MHGLIMYKNNIVAVDLPSFSLFYISGIKTFEVLLAIEMFSVFQVTTWNTEKT